MSNYVPLYQITDKMLQYVSAISEKVGQITERSHMESKPHLRRNNKIKSIHSSLRIEANSLSLDEVKDVINGRTVLGAAKEIQEVKNAYEAYERISSIDPFSLTDLKTLHGIMTKYIEGTSGEFRLGEEGVFNGDQCIFMAPPAKFVPNQIEELFRWMKSSRSSVHPLIMAAVFHYEFVFIHPFTDGNGRMARLWHTAILMQWKPIFEYIPIETQIEKFQDGYYQAIADSHIAGNSNLFIEFMLDQIDTVLDEIRVQASKSGADISAYVKRLLDVMEYDTAYTANDILAMLGLKSKETLRKNYLNPAISNGMIVMTLPDKPNSRNQRYVKV